MDFTTRPEKKFRVILSFHLSNRARIAALEQPEVNSVDLVSRDRIEAGLTVLTTITDCQLDILNADHPC
jgi:hypothetical protein